MNEDSRAVDPYEAVLADLRVKRDKIDQAISIIESVRGLAVPSVGATTIVGGGTGTPTETVSANAFHGMSIADAAKALLLMRQRDLSNFEIADAFRGGGLIMNSVNPANTIGSILARRFEQMGDVVRVGRGKWGLTEWHPTIRFKSKADKKGGDGNESGGSNEDGTDDAVPENLAATAQAPVPIRRIVRRMQRLTPVPVNG